MHRAEIISGVILMPLQITLPGQNTGGKVVGIDLGTTNSLVAYVEFGEAKVISGRDGGLVPSVVTLDDYGNVVAIGIPAKKTRTYRRSPYDLFGQAVNGKILFRCAEGIRDAFL